LRHNASNNQQQEGVKIWKAILRATVRLNFTSFTFNNLFSTQKLLQSQKAVCLFKDAHYIRILHISLSKSQAILLRALQKLFSSLNLQTDPVDQDSFFLFLGHLLSIQMIRPQPSIPVGPLSTEFQTNGLIQNPARVGRVRLSPLLELCGLVPS
jgi:hypothetical protein